ncbi:MAG: hypothetical protein ACRDZ4_01635 [Egibacteraceae bacterium]
MTESRALTLRLPPADYARLEGEAKRLGVRPGTLARMLVHAALDTTSTARGLASVVARVRARASRLPSVDAVALIRAGRDELEARAPGRS